MGKMTGHEKIARHEKGTDVERDEGLAAQTQALYEDLTMRLIADDTSISTMESCTSGAIASLITDTEGASAIFKGGFITYSNEAKVAAGVDERVIEEYGVYSPQTACAMAAACREAFGVDIGIGVTGSFGTIDPANADSVPGEVDFAIAQDGGVQAFRVVLPDGMDRRDSKLYVAREVAYALGCS